MPLYGGDEDCDDEITSGPAPTGDLDEPCDECGADAGERCRRTCPTRND